MHLMIFDLEFKGHHVNYIRHIVSDWHSSRQNDLLSIVVSPNFLKQHPAVVGFAHKSGGKIKFISISDVEKEDLLKAGKATRIVQRLKEWSLFCKYAKHVSADHCLVMYIDKLQLPIALGLRPPCQFSGIYFQPSFHYTYFQPKFSERELFVASYSLKSLFKELRDFVFLAQVNYNPQFKNLFVLDPYAVAPIKKKFKNFGCLHLPDPVESLSINSFPDKDKLLEKNKITFLIFGYLDERKGISKFLDALEILPIEICAKIRLLLVGELDASLKENIPNRLKAIAATKSITFLTDFKFVSEKQIQSYFDVSDVVLALYQNHLGMSGILLHAAMMKKPVLSQDYGLMGKLVREYDLGITVDSTDSVKIAEKIKFLFSILPEKLGNPHKMATFVKSNSVDKFTKTILGALCKPS